MATPNGVHAEPGKQYTAQTGREHVFWIENYVMTISFILAKGSERNLEYPRYVLESSNGSYHAELSSRSNLVSCGDYFHLRFEKLKPGMNYKLTRFLAEDYSEVVFDGLPLDKIVDQDRPVHELLKNHGYAELDAERCSTAAIPTGSVRTGASIRTIPK